MIIHIEQGRDGSWCAFGKIEGRPYCAHGQTKAGAMREALSLKLDVIHSIARDNARSNVVPFPRPAPNPGPSAA